MKFNLLSILWMLWVNIPLRARLLMAALMGVIVWTVRTIVKG